MIPVALRSPLTDRQADILQFLADDLAPKEVAQKLGISPATVKNHTLGFKERLGKNTVHGAVAEAMRNMWIV